MPARKHAFDCGGIVGIFVVQARQANTIKHTREEYETSYRRFLPIGNGRWRTMSFGDPPQCTSVLAGVSASRSKIILHASCPGSSTYDAMLTQTPLYHSGREPPATLLAAQVVMRYGPGRETKTVCRSRSRRFRGLRSHHQLGAGYCGGKVRSMRVFSANFERFSSFFSRGSHSALL